MLCNKRERSWTQPQLKIFFSPKASVLPFLRWTTSAKQRSTFQCLYSGILDFKTLITREDVTPAWGIFPKGQEGYPETLSKHVSSDPKIFRNLWLLFRNQTEITNYLFPLPQKRKIILFLHIFSPIKNIKDSLPQLYLLANKFGYSILLDEKWVGTHCRQFGKIFRKREIYEFPQQCCFVAVVLCGTAVPWAALLNQH